ncbi:serine/threonine protein phosphatase [Candidatus Dependentiae bacterium]|nr:serine/threonine protein phosphatase [Candidatus Dependentiae bacterium]
MNSKKPIISSCFFSFLLASALVGEPCTTTESSLVFSQTQNFRDFKNAALKIPTFQELYIYNKIDKHAQLRDKDQYRKLRLLSLEDFESILDEFFCVMDTLLRNSSTWLNSDCAASEVIKSSFLPYAQKIVKNVKSKTMLKGDLHGDIHSLIAAVEHLQELGITSAHNPLKIEDPSFHLIFLGDYVDRGIWGTEVLFLLMLLKCINPSQVILIRGNHEDPNITSQYGFKTEFFAKFSKSSLKDRQRCYQKICAFYEYLPVVLYLGSGTDTHKNYLQCCHGGLEIGYNPRKFLKSSDTISFHSIDFLNQATESKKLSPFKVCGHHCMPLENYCSDFKPTSPYQLGFLWNDFLVDAQEISCYKEGRGFVFNKDITHAVLQAASSKQAQLVGVVRAHQHVPSNRNPMMKLLLSSHGCASLWRDPQKELTFTQGTVLTLLLSPDSLHGQPRKAHSTNSTKDSYRYDGFTYDTSLLLTTGVTLAEWRGTIHNNYVYDKRKEYFDSLVVPTVTERYQIEQPSA